MALRRKNKGGFERRVGKNREGRAARRRRKHAQDRLACGARRGRSSYKRADNGEDGEKSAEKLTIENKFHVKQTDFAPLFPCEIINFDLSSAQLPLYEVHTRRYRCVLSDVHYLADTVIAFY